MPALTSLWSGQARRGAEPSAAVKLAMGCAIHGAGWAVLAVGSIDVSAEAKVPLLLPVCATLLITLGQLHVAPIGLALVSACAHPRARSSAVGLWFVAGGLAGLIAGPGALATHTHSDTTPE